MENNECDLAQTVYQNARLKTVLDDVILKGAPRLEESVFHVAVCNAERTVN
jgi:hypothetical protein